VSLPVSSAKAGDAALDAKSIQVVKTNVKTNLSMNYSPIGFDFKNERITPPQADRGIQMNVILKDATNLQGTNPTCEIHNFRV